MPILHLQLSGEGLTPDGRTVTIPHAVALQQRGPVVQVSVTVEETIARTLAEQGRELPTPLTGLGLIDTGASVTCIDEEAARRLGLPVIDVERMSSATHAQVDRNVYPIQVEVIGFPIRLQAPRAIGAELSPQGLLLLIGRDVLQICTLFYNGPTGELTLSI